MGTPVRIGLLGAGTIGCAVARLVRDRASDLEAAGLSCSLGFAVVRDAERPRDGALHGVPLVTDGRIVETLHADVIVEVLGGVEPAGTLVQRALQRGVPVVTANKSLVAAHGEALTALACAHATTLRYEASCIAGVPFLGTFARRPLAAGGVTSLTALLNGTCNFILTAMTEGTTFAAALADAQARGYAEPDPSMDIGGGDAAEKLAILVHLFARRGLAPRAIPTRSIARITVEDIASARAAGRVVKQVARAAWADGGLEVSVGPEWLAADHPLARVSGVTNGILLDSGASSQCYIGPGAGPDITAEALLDDVVETVRQRERARC